MSRHMSNEISKGMRLIFAKAEFVVVGRVFFGVCGAHSSSTYPGVLVLPAYVCLVSSMLGIWSERGCVEGRKSFRISWWVQVGRLAGTCLLWGSLRILLPARVRLRLR